MADISSTFLQAMLFSIFVNKISIYVLLFQPTLLEEGFPLLIPHYKKLTRYVQQTPGRE